MKIAVIMDPLANVQIHADTTFGWMLAAQARGHELFYVKPADLVAEGNAAHCWAAPTQVCIPKGDEPHYTLGESVYRPMSDFDVAWMRRDPPFDTDYLYSTYILELADEHGDCWVINRPGALRDANEKAFILHFPELTPRTLICRRKDRIKAFMHAEEGARCIVKPLVGHGGEEVFMAVAEDLNLNTILEVVTRHESRYVMVQTYIPEARDGDKRIVMIDGEPIGAILRVPASGELRGNLHVGGSAVKAELTPRDLEICKALGPRLRADGLHFVGIDILGSWLTEVNVTSPTGIREMSVMDGIDYSDRWIAWIEERLEARRT